MAKLDFQQPLLQSSVLHDPTEIILICWFGAEFVFIYIYIQSVFKIIVELKLCMEIMNTKFNSILSLQQSVSFNQTNITLLNKSINLFE